MKTDTFTKVTLAVIAVSLFLIAFKPLLHPSPAVASPTYKMDYIQSFGTAMYGNKNIIVLFDSRTGQVWAYGINVEGEPSYLGKLIELGKPIVKQ
jgi:hypothetical protein